MGKALTRPAPRVARQTSYGEYTLPPGMSSLMQAPLYQAVAVWGWQLGRPFSRDEIAKAFRISAHRASDVMSYIRRARTDVVTTRQYYERGRGGTRLRFMHILSEPQFDGRPVRRDPRPVRQEEGTPQTELDLQALRHWFICRP